MRFIVPVVEGDGDEIAAPVLVRRILNERMNRFDFDVLRPKRARGRGDLIKRLENYVGYAAMTEGCTAILALLDADEDCPCELGIELANRARSTRLVVPTAVVCAKWEYESWFLASFEDFTDDPEEYGDAKSWLEKKLEAGFSYKPTRDQVKFSANMDIGLALERSRSFRRLCSALDELIAFADAGEVGVTPGG